MGRNSKENPQKSFILKIFKHVQAPHYGLIRPARDKGAAVVVIQSCKQLNTVERTADAEGDHYARQLPQTP